MGQDQETVKDREPLVPVLSQSDSHCDSQSDTQSASASITDVVKAKQIEQEFADIAQQMELSRYASFAAYQDALMALEKALGIRIEQALRRGVDAP